MRVLLSVSQQKVLHDDNILYAIINRDYMNVDVFDCSSFEQISSLSVLCLAALPIKAILDLNYIYVIDKESNLVIIDRFNGEIQTTVALKSICISNILQDDDYLYMNCVLPTRTKIIDFSTYFLQKISKKDASITKFAMKRGEATEVIHRHDDGVLIADTNNLHCISLNGNEVWSISLSHRMENPLITNNKYVVASSSSGLLRAFDVKNGQNCFNIQLPASELKPIITNEHIYWFSNEHISKIHIDKIKNREKNWQTKTKSLLKDPVIHYIANNKMIVGNKSGQVYLDNIVFQLPTKNPVLSIERINDHLLVETINRVQLLGDINWN